MKTARGPFRHATPVLVAGLLWLARGLCADTVHYELIEGSSFVDDCSICDRPTILYKLRGGFDLVEISANTLFTQYAASNIQFAALLNGATAFKVQGSGKVEIGGEVALIQRWELQLSVISPSSTNQVVLTNKTVPLDRVLPNLSVSLVQSNGTLTSTIYIELKAAPMEELWFLTHQPVGAWSAGDILSSRGRLVKARSELLNEAGLANPPAGVSIDALDIRAGYRFSISNPASSSTIGDGDLTSGATPLIPATQWKTALGISADAPDPGLDAAHLLDAGDTAPVDFLFSIRQPVFSPKLNRQIGRGDLIRFAWLASGDDIAVLRSNSGLLALFHPPEPKHDYGLDAVYQWRHGEIWFSVEEGFVDAQLGAISEGDLLSDRGYVVWRNDDLLRNFPEPTNADAGLGDFFVVTDLATGATPWVLDPLVIDAARGDVAVSWRSSLAPSTVVQLERAPHAGGPFQAISPIITERRWIDPGAFKTNQSAVYRLRQWP